MCRSWFIRFQPPSHFRVKRCFKIFWFFGHHRIIPVIKINRKMNVETPVITLPTSPARSQRCSENMVKKNEFLWLYKLISSPEYGFMKAVLFGSFSPPSFLSFLSFPPAPFSEPASSFLPSRFSPPFFLSFGSW